MAKPIKPNPILTGKAARELRDYLAGAKPDADKAKRNERDVEVYQKTKVH